MWITFYFERNAVMLSDVLTLWGGQEVTAMDVYRDMFQFGEGYLQKENDNFP